MNKQIYYVAIPYTWNPEKSFEISNKVGALLIEGGYVIFAPVSHSHPISKKMSPEKVLDQNTWMNQDIPILRKCDKMILVMIGEDGDRLINESKGCQREIKEAKKAGIPISYLLYEED
jgi:hypothetical protein